MLNFSQITAPSSRRTQDASHAIARRFVLVLTFVTLVTMVFVGGRPDAASADGGAIGPAFVGAPYFAPGAVYSANFPDPNVVWDPDMRRYYAFSTTTGGVYVPVMWSTDLVTWTARTRHAIPNPNGQFHDALPDPSPDGVTWNSGNPSFPDEVWGPTVAKLSGNGSSAWFMFYALRVNEAGRHCLYYATSATPDGPYLSPTFMSCSDTPMGVIDPYIFTDPSTGSTWLMWQDQGEVGRTWSSIWMREITMTGPRTVSWSDGSSPVFLLEGSAPWERGVIENPSMARLADGVPTLFYSGGIWNSDTYAVGTARCSAIRFSWTPICTRVGTGQAMSARQGMRGIGGSSAFLDSSGAPHIADHYWAEGSSPNYPGNQRRLVVDRVYETPGGIAFSHESGPPGEAAPSGYVSVGPMRMLDTRIGLGTTSTRTLEAGEIFVLDLRSQTTLTTTSVTLNVTVDGAADAGYLSVYGCGAPPSVSTLNYVAGATSTNLATVRLNTSRRVCISTQSRTHLIVDLQGRYDSSVSSAITPLDPSRILDTRSSRAVDGGSQIEVSVAQAGVPPGATAVLVSLTADDAAGDGYLTAWQCGGAVPTVSNVNYRTRWPTGNGAIVPLSGNRTFCVSSSMRAHVIVDVFGYVGPSGQRLSAIAPVRVLDSRDSVGLIDGGRTVPVAVIGAGMAASRSTAVEVNITATDARAVGWVSVFPCSTPPSPGSETSVLNLLPGQTKAAHVVVPVGVAGSGAGEICLRSQNPTHLIVDLSGGYL